MGSRRLTVVIVSYNSAPELTRCLAVLSSATRGIDATVVVVDNGSRDNSVDIARAAGAVVIENRRNVGFARAVNAGLRVSQGDLLLLLNPDVELAPGSITALAEALDRTGATAVGPCTVDSEGRVNTTRYYLKAPTFWQVLFFYTRLFGASQSEYRRCRWFNECGLGEEVREVDQIPGACLLTTADAIDRIGPFDERFPIWFEDVDWSERVRRAGGRLLYIGSIVITHSSGASFARWRSPTKEAMFYRSLLLYCRKFHWWWPFAWLLVIADRIARLVVTRRAEHARVLRWLVTPTVPLPQ